MRQTFPVHSPPLNLCLWFYSIAWIVFNSLKSLLYRGQTSLLTLERTRLYFTSNPEEETRGTSAGGETSREAAHNTIELITCTVECTYVHIHVNVQRSRAMGPIYMHMGLVVSCPDPTLFEEKGPTRSLDHDVIL